MLFRDAAALIGRFLSPLPLDDFLDKILTDGVTKIEGGDGAWRAGLLGPDPEALLCEAVQLAPRLTFHAANPLGPPPSLDAVADSADFRRRIGQFLANHYSVRFPEMRTVSPGLEALARALEILLHGPVTVSAFWSRGKSAAVSSDDHDLLIAQLRGTRRWDISTALSDLDNAWQRIPGRTPTLGPHEAVDMRPGDLLYLPRGTRYGLESEAESLHLAVGFVPLTVREALLAVLDHLSDVDRTLRTTIGGRLAFQLQGTGLERLGPPVLDAAARVLAACRTPGFIAAALHRRSARGVALLAPLPVRLPLPALDLDSVLVQASAAFCHLTANSDTIDFSYPGGHLYIRLAAQESLRFMVNTPRFKVRDIPAAADDEVRLSLATKFLEAGYLELATGGE